MSTPFGIHHVDIDTEQMHRDLHIADIRVRVALLAE